MLLRIGLIYTLSVLSFVLTGFVLWQSLSLKAGGASFDALATKYERLAKEHEELRIEEQAADRRARVAEDSLSRAGTLSADEEQTLKDAGADLVRARVEKAALEDERSKLESAMKTVLQERDAAKADAASLRGRIETVLKSEKDAREAAERAVAELKALRDRPPPVIASPAPSESEPATRPVMAEPVASDPPATAISPAVPAAPVVANPAVASPATAKAAAAAPARAIENVKARKVVAPAPTQGWGVKVVAPPPAKPGRKVPAPGIPLQNASKSPPIDVQTPTVDAQGAPNTVEPKTGEPEAAPATGEDAKAKIDPTSAPEIAQGNGSVPNADIQPAAGEPAQPAEAQAAAKPAKSARSTSRSRPKRDISNPLEGFFPF